MPGYLLLRWKSNVEVADSSLWQAFCCLWFFQKGQATTRFLAGVSHLQMEFEISSQEISNNKVQLIQTLQKHNDYLIYRKKVNSKLYFLPSMKVVNSTTLSYNMCNMTEGTYI